VGSGKSLIDPTSAQRLTRELTTAEFRPPLHDDEPELLSLILEGLTDAQIAERLDMPRELAAARISALVARIIRPEGHEESIAQPTPPGKHRRSDD
jgi:DNA-binding NarL/FixJ family response regulator